jgi:hypothetical protein
VKHLEAMAAACGEIRHDEELLGDLSMWPYGTARQEFHARAEKSTRQAESC